LRIRACIEVCLYARVPQKALRMSQQPSNADSEKSLQHDLTFESRQCTYSLYLHLGVMFTFGVASPYLNFVVGCSFVLRSMLWTTMLGRYIRLSKSSSTISDSTMLVSDLGDAWKGSVGPVWMIMTVSLFAWGFFNYDIIGDVYGPTQGGVIALAVFVGTFTFVCMVYNVHRIIIGLFPAWSARAYGDPVAFGLAATNSSRGLFQSSPRGATADVSRWNDYTFRGDPESVTGIIELAQVYKEAALPAV
jgi:hypothetical protein